MKKSPFSTPRGNGGRPGFGWNSGGSPGRGYARSRKSVEEYLSPNRSQASSHNQSGGEDFIPFDSCTPPSGQRNSGGNWQSPKGQWQCNNGGRGGRRHSGSPGYNNYRDNNRGRDHHQPAPFYVDTGKQFYGQRRNFQRGRGSHNKADISTYVNLRSFLEDPWAELTTKLNRTASGADSQSNISADLSFSSVLGDVCLDDSATSTTSVNPSSQEAVVDESPIESDGSFVQTSQELMDSNVCLDGSKDPKPRQDSND